MYNPEKCGVYRNPTNLYLHKDRIEKQDIPAD